MNESIKVGIGMAADTLVSQASLFNCGTEKAWDEHMDTSITKLFTFEEVHAYILERIERGQDIL